MELLEHPFPCRVVRHRGARRITLRVGEGGVRVTVPRGVPQAEVDRFLAGHRDWVRARLAALPVAPPLRDGALVALLDGTLVLRSGSGRARLDGGRLVVPPDADGTLEGPVERWYRRRARRELEARSRALAEAMGREVAGVAVRDPRSRWGSCSARGRLSYSWRLVLAPEYVLDYVVAHEVCHLVRGDHSPAFWDLVEQVRPGHAAARDWLRHNGERLRLGPAWRSLSPA